jgi:hypothetical protein
MATLPADQASLVQRLPHIDTTSPASWRSCTICAARAWRHRLLPPSRFGPQDPLKRIGALTNPDTFRVAKDGVD